MTPEDFADLLALGGERSHVEFKGPGIRSDRGFFQKVVRAVLAMTNRRDGGTVVIGVDDDRGVPVATGLSSEQLATWGSDAVRDALAAYADPSVDVEVQTVVYGGKSFVVIDVREFADVPVICRRDGESLREGEIYMRSRRKPESVPIPRQAEMRDLIELATEKRLRRFLAAARAAGMEALAHEPSSAERFAEQAARFIDPPASPVVAKALSRGHWRFSVGPADFIPNRIADVTSLAGIVYDARIESRGWVFPSVWLERPPRIGEDWAEQDLDTRIHVEGWRLYQSGLFTSVTGIWDDWYEQDDIFGPPPGGVPPVGAQIYAEAIVSTLAEFYEFSARFAVSPAGAERMRLSASIHGIKDRELRLGGRRVGFSTPRRGGPEQFVLPAVTVTREELLAAPRDLAATAAQEILRRFNWSPDVSQLRAMQEER